MKLLALSALAAALSAAPMTALAQEFTLDLSKVDRNTPEGQERIAEWKLSVAESYCGPVDMPQPIDLANVRAKCQVDIKAQAQARIDAAYARQETVVRYTVATKDK